MPDFFTRLAERTLGLANTIQPVVPSLFAPGAPLIDGQAEAEQELTTEERAPQPDRAAPEIDALDEQRRNPAQQIAPRSVIGPPDEPPAPTVERARPAQLQIEPAARSEPHHAVPAAEAPQMIERLSAAPPTSPIRQPAERSQPPRTTMRAEVDQLVSTPDVAPSSKSIAPRPAVDQQPAATAPSARSLVTAQPVDLHAPDRSTVLVPVADERHAPSVERQTNTTQAERPALVVREPSMPRIQPAQRAPEPPAAQPAPQIHVSIGRIEVRAVTTPPAATPPPKPTPTPHISLDDYLRSQNGDRR